MIISEPRDASTKSKTQANACGQTFFSPRLALRACVSLSHLTLCMAQKNNSLGHRTPVMQACHHPCGVPRPRYFRFRLIRFGSRGP